jgi:hypothetical protein
MSLPPSSGVMNPKPFSVLKNFTLPLDIVLMGIERRQKHRV